MRVRALIPLAVCVACAAGAAEPSPRFRLGSFERQGAAFVGLVLEDGRVVDVRAASAALETARPTLPKLDVPSEMKALIERYDVLRERLQTLAADAGRAGTPDVYELAKLRVRPPLVPGAILNAAVNYTEHEREMRPGETPAPVPGSIPGLWQRREGDARQNPYLFLKSPRAVIADGEPILIPPGRDRIDWECELAVVIGRRATRVLPGEAPDYVFGYTLENDVSDRAGRGDGRHGSDWLVGKSHDSFAPLGPFLVPRELVPDPQRLAIRFSLSGTLMQDSTTARMTHDVFELLSYASHVMTLEPGDVIATGSPAGVGSARTPPIFMKPGDVASCSVEGIGTLSNPVAAAPELR